MHFNTIFSKAELFKKKFELQKQWNSVLGPTKKF